MEKLNNLLRTFNGGTSSEDSINKEFAKLAKTLLYGGHFRVMDSKNIYLEEIEFYYHEENGSIKDPIMYHTNDHAPEDKTLPYFKIGRFNMHASGVDVTFENEEKQYRASFLIRAYSIDNGKKIPNSTFIYDDMFFMGIPTDEPIEIEWVEDEMDEKTKNLVLEGTWRRNVPEYEKDDKGAYKRDDEGKYQKVVTKDTGDDTFACGKVRHEECRRYKKCGRKWRFIKQH